MTLDKIARRSLPDEVYSQLLGELVDGTRGPGATLPSERALAEVLGVSRPAVREALQRMAHAGLVEVRQGGSTTVSDFRRTGGLDLLAHLLQPGGVLDVRVARSILEARQSVGPTVAALAARRAPAGAAADLALRVQAIREDVDPVGRQIRALEFWEYLVDAADSIAFRLMFNSLRAAYEPALEALAVLMAAEVDRVELYDDLAAAVAAGDEELARRTADDLLSFATRALLGALEQLGPA